MAGTDVPIDQVKSICKNSENTNEIQELLVQIETGSANEVKESISVLFGVFSYHLKVGTWLKKENKHQQHDEESVAKDILSTWLSSSYTAFLALLSQKLGNDSPQIQCKAMETFLQLVNREHETGKSDTNPPGRFIVLLKELLHCNITDELTTLVDDHIKYLDIQYYFLQKIAVLYEEQNFETNEYVIQNTFKILQLITNNFIDVEEGQASLYFHQRDTKLRRHYKSSFNSAWLTFLRQSMTSTLQKKVLIDLDTKVIPHLSDPKVLIDFLTNCYSYGGVTSLLALNSLFILINEHNLDYPDFYTNLYRIIDPSIFHMKYKSRFFHSIDMFLSSTHLPAYLIAAFVKKFSRMLLFTPAPDLMMMLVLIKNMLIRHPSCVVLIHRKQALKKEAEMKGDPYNYDETDLSQCRALESSLWEIQTLMSHFSSDVKKCVASFKKDLPSTESDTSDHFDHEYEEMFQEKIEKLTNTEKEIAVNFVKATEMFESMDSDCWILE